METYNGIKRKFQSSVRGRIDVLLSKLKSVGVAGKIVKKLKSTTSVQICGLENLMDIHKELESRIQERV